jgi:hypothetical protein
MQQTADIQSQAEPVFTYGITAEVSASADGVPSTVEIINAGSLDLAIARHIAVEALAGFQGSFSTSYTLRATGQGYSQQRHTETIIFTVEDFR